jgi:hypothetical protein
MSAIPVNLQIVAGALIFLGGTANLGEIYQEVANLVPDWREFYKSEDSFHATIRSTLESHCPQSEKWVPQREAMFEKIDRGRYRIVPKVERSRVIAKGVTL